MSVPRFRLMYDAVTPSRIPSTAPMVMGYANGRFVWRASDFARFRHKPHVRVDVNGSDPEGGSVLDVERGDATPRDIVPWVNERRKFGRAVVYFSLDNPDAWEEAGRCKADVFIAHYTNVPHKPDSRARGANVIACQYANVAIHGFDLSAVFDETWHPSR